MQLILGLNYNGKNLLILHGIGASEESFALPDYPNDFIEYFKADDYYTNILFYNYPSGEYIEGNASWLAAEILRNNKNVKFDVIAHSMGGLVARWLNEQWILKYPTNFSNNIERLVMVGTPNFGSSAATLADFALVSLSIGKLKVPSVDELETGSVFLKTINSGNSVQKGSALYYWYTGNDGDSHLDGCAESDSYVCVPTADNISFLGLDSTTAKTFGPTNIYTPYIGQQYDHSSLHEKCATNGICDEIKNAVTAISSTSQYTLAVSKSGTGSGTVTSSTGGISCGSTCSDSYNSGASVTLTASASSGSTFAGWSGGGCSGTGSCTMTMNAATTVTATFTATSAATPPTAPSGLVALTASTFMSLAWNDNSSDETGFKVERKTGVSGSWSQIASVGQNIAAYLDYGVSAGITYYYRVFAYNSSGVSGYSNEAFATILGIDTTPPTVSSTSPANKATGVAVNTAITATFSETMTASTVSTTTFTLNNGVTGTVTYSGTTATFTPSSNLAYSTTYTATITTGVKDSAGNAMAAAYTWTFTTGATTTPSAGQITVSPSSLNFGSVPVGSCGSAIFAIQSVSGSASGTVNVSPNPPFSIYLGSSFTVSNGSAANVSIQFCPTSASSYSGTAAITSNATFTGVSSVALSGTATPIVNQLTITTSSLAGGVINAGYNASLGASGGTPPYAWSLVQGTQLPQGLSLSNTGVISGTPITPGTASFQAQVTDSAQPSQTVQKLLSISIVGTPPGQLTMSAVNECSAATPQVRLTWTQASSVDYYQVYKDGSVLTGVSTTLPSYLDTSVALGSTYAYFIRAVNTGGTTDSNTANLSVSCVTPPGQFTLSAVTSCSGTSPVNVLNLTGSAGVVLPYSVYRDGTLLTSLSTSGFSDTAVTPGTSYTYLATASNSVGSTNSNSVLISTAANCAVPVNPSITSMSPQTATVGGGAFTLTVTGSNFDSSSKILWDPSGGTPSTQLPTNFVDSTTLTATINQTTSGFSPFTWAGTYMVQVMNTATSVTNGPRSNTVNLAVYNPMPTISSVSGSCRANLNCTPANGYDVRINGNGFVNNSTTSYVYSTFLQVNGANANMSIVGQGPVYNQLQLMVNGSLIPSSGTYTINVCNEGTIQGRACASGSLSVSP